MMQDAFKPNETLQQFFNFNENIWQKIQEFYYGESPLSEALTKINTEDLGKFYEAVAKIRPA